MAGLMSDFETEPMPIPSWMIIDASRYAVGRMTYQVGATVDWLIAHWDKLPEHAKSIIERDLETEFKADDRARSEGLSWRPLGMDMDRRQWERLRTLWRDVTEKPITEVGPGDGRDD